MKKRIIALILSLSMMLSLVVMAEDAPTSTPCATCGAVDCHSTHVNWCPECRVDNCEKIHVPAPVNAETSTEDPLVGKLVKFNKEFPKLFDKPNGTERSANAKICPTVLRIVEVCTDNASRTLYLVEAVEGTWDSYYDGYRYAIASEMELIEEEPAPLPPCEICGKPGCTAYHVFCDSCGKYDCGLAHDQVDNTPPSTPTVPENPTLVPGADVTLTDSYGKPLQGISLPAGVKTSVSAFAAMGSNVSYQWQVCYNNANDLWIDIHGATGQGLLISPAMFRNVVDAFGTTYLRCRAIGNSTMVYSDPIPVTLQEVAAGAPVEAAFPVEELESLTYSSQAPVAEIPALLAAEAAPAADDIKHAVTIRYQFTDGTIAANTVTLLISHGTNYPLSVESPSVKGYAPDIAVVEDNIVAISGAKTYTVTYHPALTDFVVEHYLQNLGNDNYYLDLSETIHGLYTGDAVGNGLAKDYTGFDPMVYDYTTTVAADGSTVIEIYYDREYFMLRLDLQGGYGAEPMFARYGTPVTVTDPEKKGYTFNGWSPALPGTILEETSHTATWKADKAKYTVAFYHENANNDQYTFVGSIQKEGTTGASVTPTYSDYSGAAGKVAGVDTKNFPEKDDWTSDTAEDNWYADPATVEADGTTVVNLYIGRREYTLTYYWPLCTQHTHDGNCCTKTVHTHPNANCCTLQHIHNETPGSCCNIHVHTKDCIKNEIYEATNQTYIDAANAAYQDGAADGQLYTYTQELIFGIKDYYYFVCFGGVWYRRWVNTEKITWNSCGSNPQPAHKHGSGCNTNGCGKTAHDHSAGALSTCNSSACTNGNQTHSHGDGSCNTDKCSHLKQINADNPYACGCHGANDTASEWTIANGGEATWKIKYGAYVADKHAMMETSKGYGWTDGALGNGGRKISFYSMPDHDKAFYRISNGSRAFYVTYFLEETEPNTGTRTYDGVKFTKDKTTFHNHMGYLGWGTYDDPSDYLLGIPDGFKEFECTYGDDENNASYAVDNFTTKLSDYIGKNSGSESPYNNYYFLRKVFNVAYYNNETLIGTKTAKYEQPIRDGYDLTQARAEALQGIAMVSPYGPGYEFVGWYLDPAGTVEADFTGNMLMPNAGNEHATGIALFAKWAPITRDLVVKVDGTVILKTTAAHGSAPVQAATAPEKDGYRFLGWFYQDGDQEKAYDFSMPVYRNMDLYAKYVSDTLASGYIYYRLPDGTDIGSPTPISGSVNYTKTYSAKYGDQLLPAYQQGYFPQEPSHSITFKAGASAQNDFIFYYTKRENVKYTIHFVNSADTSHNIFDPFTDYSDKTSVVYNLLTNSKTKDGWKVDAVEKEFFLSSNESLNEFWFYYTEAPDAVTVQVEHYTKNAQSGKYQLVTTETREMTKNQKVDISPLSIPGYKFATADGNGVTLTTNAHLVKMYYDPLSYSYVFRYLLRDNDDDDSNNVVLADATSGTALYGAIVNRTAPAVKGYQAETAAASITVDLDASKNVRVFYYNEQQATFNYRVGAINGGTVSKTKETVGAVKGNPSGATAAVTDAAHYTFTGWYSDFALQHLLTENETYVPSKTDGIYVSAYYYAGFAEAQVPVKYVLVGPAGSATLSVTTENVDIFTGMASGTDVTPTEGYRIVGWYDNAECSGQSLGQQLFFRPGLPNGGWGESGKTYYVKIEEQTTVARFVAVGPGSVEPSSQSLNRVTGTVTAAATPLEYAEFVGWFDNAECTGTPVSTSATNTFAAPGGLWPADGKTYYGKFKLSEFTVTFDLNGGTTEDPTAVTYRYGDTLAFPNAVNGVYVPTWTVKTTDGSWPAVGTVVTAADLASGAFYGSVTLRANWDVQVVWFKEQPTLANYSDALIFHQQTFASTETITHPASNPAKATGNGYTYSFKEWVELDLTQFEAMNGGQKFLGYKVYYATYNRAVIDYTVTMELEGGVLPEDRKENPIHYNVETGAFTLPQPTKTGYEFLGWTGNAITEPAKNLQIGHGSTGNRTYVANWKAEEYTITYDLAGGTDPGNPGSYTVESGVITLVAPSKEGYTFTGWTGTGLNELTESVTVPAGSMGNRTYTANWEVNQYTVTLSGDEGIATLTGAGTYDYGTEVTVTATLKPGYDWVNWTGAATVTEVSFTFTVPAGDVAYAANTQIHTYTITYQLNGGTMKEGEANPGTYQVITPTFSLYNPVKTGYIFDGWNTVGNDPASVALGTTGNITFTALWKTQPYTITYNLDGGAVDPANTGEYTIESAPINLTAPTKKGYEFKGWTGTGLDAAAMTVTIPTGSTGNREYTATWQLVEYTITYDLKDGTLPADKTIPATYTVETPDIVLPQPTRPGYEFKGWEGTDLTGAVTAVTIAKGSVGNRSYTAKWAEKRVTINYVMKPDATMGSVTPSSEYVDKATGTAQGATATAKPGYRFVGWYSDADCTVLLTENAFYQPQKEQGSAAWEKDAYVFYAKFVPSHADLTITATCADADQAFIYQVTGTALDGRGVSFTVTVPAGKTVTVKSIPVGTYTVTQKTGWNWRYTTSNASVTVSVGGENAVTFTYTNPITQWLNDYDRVRKGGA